ncbi:class II aldolase/adducin family protein [Butyrivibrio sp. AE2032]|uniref:class II aldolase/adducin family protein n=1 Tax=Butyrivibrio sp. AE2032 TaxID=1458463 RepID=UPI00068F7442|nr:class II aldolase/adducin family protein [Butyrivibrio sp. AE2032]
MKHIDLQEEREHIIQVSRELHEVGLLVRTWGNISSRVDKDHFLVTPSGIKYEDLTPEMISLVNINDLSFEGDYKPSSESKVHAYSYKVRPDAGFIVHTHQVFASCAGTLGVKKVFSYFYDEDVTIPVAPYALPGTEKLAENVARTLNKYKDSNGIIMANHGTLCLGGNSKEAIFEAEMMETACNDFLIDVCKTDMTHGVEVGYNSHLENGVVVYDQKDTPERVKSIHEQIYSKRRDINYIIHNKSEAVMTVSRRANHMRPLLDDFAQLIGVSVKIPNNEDEIYHNIKKNVNVVFSPNDGAYCVGSTEDDAQAVAIVLDKGCIAYMAVMRNGEGHYLSKLECIKMNRHYRKSYSKLADINKD